MNSRNSALNLTLCLMLTASVLALSPEVQSASLNSKRTAVTLDPETLRQVREKLDATSESSVPAESQDSFVFEDSNAIIGSRFETGRDSEPQVKLEFRDSLVFQDNLPTENNDNAKKPTNSHTCANPRERYDLASGACHRVGKIGAPCGENMLFYANVDDKIYGTCDCIEQQDVPLVFNVDTGKCHATYKQAYCPTNHWLVFDASETPICEPRKCPNGKVSFHGRCVKLDEPDQDCQKSERVLFQNGDLTPSCGMSANSEHSNLSGPKLKCRPGSSQDIVGKCLQS